MKAPLLGPTLVVVAEGGPATDTTGTTPGTCASDEEVSLTTGLERPAQHRT